MEPAGSVAAPAEEFWAIALAEFDGASRRPGLWAKSFAGAEGNEAVAKAAYLSERAKQLFAAAQAEHLHREAALDAERKLVEYRAGLTHGIKDIHDNLEHAKLNGISAIGSVVKLIRLLGGSVDWKTVGLLSSGWVVTFAGKTHSFSTGEELSAWATGEVFAAAELALPPVLNETLPGSRTTGLCPNCNAIVLQAALSCLSCQANFGPGSAWKPVSTNEA